MTWSAGPQSCRPARIAKARHGSEWEWRTKWFADGLGNLVAVCSPREVSAITTLRRALRIGLRLCLAALTVASTVRAAAAPQGGKVIRFVRDPDPAPNFKLEDLQGKTLTLASAHGKVVLLNFWASWCGPCRAEIPDLIALQDKYKGQLQIIGLTVDDDDAGMIRKVVAAAGINYPVAMASEAVSMQYGGVAALPTSFLLDREGRVVQKHEGLRDPSLYETEIRALLGLAIEARVETFVDTGQVFLEHANRASELPGVDLSKLTPEQKQAALHAFNAEMCDCGCNFTLAQCRVWDRNCAVSLSRTARIVDKLRGSSKSVGTSDKGAPAGPSRFATKPPM